MEAEKNLNSTKGLGEGGGNLATGWLLFSCFHGDQPPSQLPISTWPQSKCSALGADKSLSRESGVFSQRKKQAWGHPRTRLSDRWSVKTRSKVLGGEEMLEQGARGPATKLLYGIRGGGGHPEVTWGDLPSAPRGEWGQQGQQLT